MIITTRTKQVGVVVLAGLLAVAMAVAILIIGLNTQLFTPSKFNSDYFVQYGLSSMKVETGKDNKATGLPSRTINFTFDDQKNEGRINLAGLSVLGESIQKEIKETPALYNVKGSTSTSIPVSFEFQSVSPSDYTDRTYPDAYTSFSRIANDRNLKAFTYKSEVNNTGQRLVSVNVEVDNNSGGSVAQSIWSNLVKDLPVLANTSYSVFLKTATATIHSTFTTEDERTALENTDVALWNNIMAYSSGRNGKFVTYGFTSVDLFISPVAGSNATTISLTVPAETDKAAFVNSFREKATNDPDVALPYGITTTIRTDGEETPFHIEYPSNREW